jgi:hypothetical protein
MDKPNVCLLEGNHEVHVQDYGNGVPAKSREFETKTKNQLIAAGYSEKDARMFYRKLRQFSHITWNGLEILACHAGIPNLKKNLLYIPTHKFIHGTGTYAEYTINAESIEHFTPVTASITDTMPDHNDSKTFTYNRITHTLTINYVDGNGAVLETAYTATVGEALAYSVESPTINGYSTTDTVVSGTMGNTDTTIDVVYTEI